MGTIYVMERHHELLQLWRDHGATGLRVVHLDFHCDLRGMLIDRTTNRAYRIRDRFPALDQGNFLAHAILEGRLDSLRWVHDEPGGRPFDIGTVKYESDLTALPHRMALRMRGTPGIPIEHDVVRTTDWQGLRPGEFLDIDWDYFACTQYSAESIPDRIERFWQQAFTSTPTEVSVCYSPEYSHPSRALFSRFVSDLADRLGFSVVELDPEGSGRQSNRRAVSDYVPAPVYQGARQTYHRTARALKRRGIF